MNLLLNGAGSVGPCLAAALPVAPIYHSSGSGDTVQVETHGVGGRDISPTQEGASAVVRPQADLAHLIWDVVEALARLDQENQTYAISLAEEVFRIAARAGLMDYSAPPLEATWCDDGSLLVEWILPSKRLAFSFAVDPGQSSWCEVTLPPSPHDRAGYLKDANFSQIIAAAIG